MNEHRINKVHFKILDPKIKMWVSETELLNFRKKKSVHFKSSELPDNWKKQTDLYYTFQPYLGGTEIIWNLEENKYFLKPYVEYELTKYFEQQGYIVRLDFINNIQVWKLLKDNNSKTIYDRYDRISVRQITTKNVYDLEMLISYDGKSLVSKRPLSKSNIQTDIIKYIQGCNIFETKRKPIENKDLVYPVLSTENKKELNIPFEGSANKNTYLEYYNKISEFYDKLLKNKTIADRIHFFSTGFDIIDSFHLQQTKKVSNSLKFKGDSDSNIYAGIKKFGPYKVPDTENLRFIFIFKQQHRNTANQLYLALKNGLSNVPGLQDYIKVKFELAKDNKIVLETSNPASELEQKLENYKKEDGLKYFAIYLTEHKRFDSIENNGDEYYKIKYILLQKEILSQFIYYRNIENDSFRFHFPNIAVAILAKLGGIPWKLDTIGSPNLIIGFGVSRLANSTYLGNTLCFKDDGEFYEFETYQRANIKTVGDALRDSINKVISKESLSPDKLIIHYYKTLSDEEAEEIENVLNELNINIPFIVLTINDTKSKDYLFFDVSYKEIMPVSGTIVEIKNKSEYLLANNERHSRSQMQTVRKFPFPLKIKVNKSSNTLHDVFDIKELIDQVYSFSRIYWKSISQISLPVTIAYSKIVADLAAHFPDHTLPDKKIAHSNLWFL